MNARLSTSRGLQLQTSISHHARFVTHGNAQRRCYPAAACPAHRPVVGRAMPYQCAPHRRVLHVAAAASSSTPAEYAPAAQSDTGPVAVSLTLTVGGQEVRPPGAHARHLASHAVGFCRSSSKRVRSADRPMAQCWRAWAKRCECGFGQCTSQHPPSSPWSRAGDLLHRML
jgi:hypothetical protein